MEVRLLELELEGFRSFKKRVTFTFPGGDSVVLIDGKWRGSETRSGTGKSSVLEGLACLLDITPNAVSNMKNWDSKKMFIRGKFAVGDSIVEAIKDPKLSLTINGEPYTSQAKGAKEKLQELLGGNTEIIKSITYRRQRKPGKIINSTDSQIKEFLSEPLRLREVENAADGFTKEVTSLTSSIELLRRDEMNLVNTMPMNMVSEEEAARAREAYTSAKARYDELSTGSVSADLKARAESIYAEINNANQVSNAVNSKRTENAGIKNAVLNLQNEIAILEKNMCPTCNREWASSQDLLKQKNALIDQYISSMRVNIEYIKNAEPVLANLANLQAQYQDIQQKIGQQAAPLNMAWQTLDSATRALNMLQSKYANYQKQDGQLRSVREQIAAKERDLQIADLSAKMLGRSGFLGSIFDEILADIEVRTNDMLQHFPNAEQFTVQIGSTKLVKTKGTTKKEITVTISRGGTDVVYDDLSGGQQSAVELCTDLAYAEAVRARSGCSLRWTCLDEVMDGLGPSEKQAVVEMIRKRIKGLVLMIEHASEIRESFDKVINIEYDGRESHVTSV